MNAPLLRCTDLRMRYSQQDSYALGDEAQGVSLEAVDGELLALLGPSGCGKTTTLRIIGGFLSPDTGLVEIRGLDVTRKAPYDRDTNTVFQSYALFPHLNLEENVAFGLKMDRIKRADRRRRVSEALELVGLGGMGEKKVGELSGGQQQRAALARAIVKQPAILLLDEPLGALDLKLRRQMQDELVRLKESTGVTFIHVTHDQEEACAIADRIAVMKDGLIVQSATPFELYRAPRNTYVASFIDAGTLVRGQVSRKQDVIEIAGPDLVVRGSAGGRSAQELQLAALIPPDQVSLRSANGQLGADSHRGVVDRCVFTGSDLDIYVRVGGTQIRAALPREQGLRDDTTVFARGAEVEVSWPAEAVVFVEDE